MVVVKIFGGLGNQMFQYAAGRGVLKDGKILYLDTNFYAENSGDNDYIAARHYELNVFKNLKSGEAGKMWLALFLNKASFFRLIRENLKSFVQFLHHPGTNYMPLSQQIKAKHVYIDGYFQSEKYFSNKRKSILREFTFPQLDEENQLTITKMNAAPNSVSLHIRRGDYLKDNISGIHGIMPLSYYHKALALLREKYHDMIVFVFSDDMPWVKKNLSTTGLETIFIENNDGKNSWKDMALMANCRHHIIANSSFSWWGAWLSTGGGDVFAPSQWFGPAIEFDINDIIPQSWTVLDYE